MKHKPEHYAKAFAHAIAAPLNPAKAGHGASHPHITGKHVDELVKNLAKLIEKNGDAAHAAKILAATEKLLRPVTGAKSIMFITARPQAHPLKKAFRALLHAHDVVREVTDSSLIGGVKIVVNEEEQFDGSLKRKIDKLFNI